MTKEDLIHLKKRENCTPEELEYQEGVWAKQKGSASDKRKMAQKISSIPKMSDENADKEIMELVSNPQLSILQVQKLLQQALKRDLNDMNFIALINTVIKKHQAVFGNKIDIQADINHQINIKTENAQVEALKERLMRHKLEKFLLGKVDQMFGYDKMIEFARAIIFELNNQSVGQLEQECENQALRHVIFYRNLSETNNVDKASRLTIEELGKIKQEVAVV